ncbi:hypothetical protein DM02DRAFT_682390 [Periconia macrospinosa]|uniref:Uncharacterized protein n=1 Tax=Periconia macrospinosa TaxID=97972 RepID=A0A2V1DM72_9PLEO|nr:hypothetical protein DM02DRAFT_682390 [Periconia macrospinosa]
MAWKSYPYNNPNEWMLAPDALSNTFTSMIMNIPKGHTLTTITAKRLDHLATVHIQAQPEQEKAIRDLLSWAWANNFDTQGRLRAERGCTADELETLKNKKKRPIDYTSQWPGPLIGAPKRGNDGTLSHTVKHIRLETHSLREKLDREQTRCNELAYEVKSYEKLVAKLQHTNNDLRTELDETKRKLEVSEDNVHDLEVEVENQAEIGAKFPLLEHQLECKEVETDELVSKCKKHETDALNLQRELTEMTNQLQTTRADLDEKTATMVTVSRDLHRLQEELAKVGKSLADMQKHTQELKTANEKVSQLTAETAQK